MAKFTGTDGDDLLKATNGIDTFTGGPGRDIFHFHVVALDLNSDLTTLTPNDLIEGFEAQDTIAIQGRQLVSSNIQIEFDAASNQTLLKIDYTLDGVSDETLRIDGDWRGQVNVSWNTELALSDLSKLISYISIKPDAAIYFDFKFLDVTGANFVDTNGFPTHSGGAGPDIFDVRGGDDTVFAGAGNDTISGGSGNDTLNGQSGNDIISGDGGNDTLNGGEDHDSLLGQLGDDILIGGAGNDFLDGGSGSDIFSGGAGADVYTLRDGEIGPGETITDLEYGEFLRIAAANLNEAVDPSRVQFVESPDPGSSLQFDFDGDGVFESTVKIDSLETGTVLPTPQKGFMVFTDEVSLLDFRIADPLAPQSGSLARNAAATAGNDTFQLAGTGKFINAGAGMDTVKFDGNSRDLLIRASQTSTHEFVEIGDAIFAFKDVEAVQFNDRILRLDGDGLAGSAYRIYQAGLGRQPDEAGLGFFVRGLDDGTFNLQSMAAAFIGSQEFKDKYGTPETITNAAFIDLLYQNVLGREGDAGGRAFHTSFLDAGGSRADAMANFAESTENKANLEPALYDGVWII